VAADGQDCQRAASMRRAGEYLVTETGGQRRIRRG
jgi:hypothetical protein